MILIFSCPQLRSSNHGGQYGAKNIRDQNRYEPQNRELLWS